MTGHLSLRYITVTENGKVKSRASLVPGGLGLMGYPWRFYWGNQLSLWDFRIPCSHVSYPDPVYGVSTSWKTQMEINKKKNSARMIDES